MQNSSLGAHRNSLMRNQYWFRQRLGAVRQQAITFTNIDPDLYLFMALSSHSELMFHTVYNQEQCSRYGQLDAKYGELNIT